MKLYKPSEAAPLIINAKTRKPGISRARVDALCRAGKIGQRVGGGWIISQQEIDEFNQQIRFAHRPKKSKKYPTIRE